MPQRPATFVRLVLLLALAAGLAALAPMASADVGDETDPGAEQADLQQRQAELSGQIDVLRASNEELIGALAAIDGQVVDQQARVAQAVAAVAAAAAAVDAARTQVEAAQVLVGQAQDRLRDAAVAAYVSSPSDAAGAALLGGDLDQLGKRLALASVPLDRVLDAIKAVSAAKDEAIGRRRELEGAKTASEAAEVERRQELDVLNAARARQQELVDEATDRLDRALAESTILAGRHAELAAELRARQQDLADRLAGTSVNLALPAPPAVVVDTDAPTAPAVDPAAIAATESDASSGAEAAAPAPAPDAEPAAPAPTEPPATAPPAAPAPPPPPPPPATIPPDRSAQITPVDTVWVGGIEVARSIAGQVQALLAAAAADGLVLTGSGYRNINDQIEIRREICGPTDYDIWDKPSWECSPPVARPGRSNHEKGLAIDFTGPDGDLVRTHDSPTFIWLAANASRFGLFNLPSEPWHWSTTGG